MSAFVFRSFSKSVRGAENWTGESVSDELVLLRLRLSHMTFSTKFFRSFVVWPVFSCKTTWTSLIISVWTDVLTARKLLVWRHWCPLQPFQVLHDEGGDRGPHRPNCPSIINARQLVRTMSFEHTEEECKVLCESLNSSASNSQYSLTGLTSCSSPASPPVANPAAPPQPPWRVRATSHLRPCFYPGFFPRQLLPLRDLDAPVGSIIQTSVLPVIGSRTPKVPAGASWCFHAALLLLFLLEFESQIVNFNVAL